MIGIKPNDYKFEIGDKVITIYGDVGEITSICDCKDCKKRGFNEPEWIDSFGETRYIESYHAWCAFEEFRQIGKYHFDNHRFQKNYILREIDKREQELNVWRSRLKVIAENEGS